MRRIIGTLVALVVALSLILIPATVSADLGKCTGWDKVKWENNQNSWKIYLEHWGRTPTSAMTRLAGLCGPDKLCSGVCNTSACPRPTGCDLNQCLGGCSHLQHPGWNPWYSLYHGKQLLTSGHPAYLPLFRR